MFFEVQARIFVQLIFFLGTFVDFRFTIFAQKELARILIHIRKMFNC